MSTVTLLLTDKDLKQLDKKYGEYLIGDNNPYVFKRYSLKDCTITVYTSKKVVFQGNEKYADQFRRKEIFPQAGSDEVGTGDFFGPICVCASLITKEDYEKIKNLNITDSKKISDDRILQIGKTLIDTIPYYCYVLDNKKYNENISTNNMNRIKARMHNYAYLKLREKTKYLPDLIVVDQFCSEYNYYQYLYEDKKIIKNIHFETKAESSYTSVAASSIIARYTFLKEMGKLSDKYHMDFPKGAGSKVDSFIKKFVLEYDKDELVNVAKLNFKNLEKVNI